MSTLRTHCFLGLLGFCCALALTPAHAAEARAATAAETQVLLEKYRCTVCHADREPLAGPSWLDIAARYTGKKQADVILSAKIRAGARGGGLWNMPPHPEVTKADAEVMATYILALRK